MNRAALIIITLCLGYSIKAQKFSFLAEAGLLTAQIDGDKLNGFDKRGVLIGIGTHYALSDIFNLGIKTSFYNQGSARKDRFQDKLPEGIQLEMDLNTIGLEFSMMYAPINKSLFFGTGFVHHQVLDYDYKAIDNVIYSPANILNPEIVSSSFNNIKFFLGWTFSTAYRITIAYEKSFTNLLSESFLNISRLRPYHLALTLSYELNPVKKKKVKNKRSRERI